MNVGGFVGWVEFDHHMSTFVPHKSDSDFFGFNEDPKTSKSKFKSRISIGSDWRTSNNLDGRISNFEGDRFGTNSSFGTASFISGGDFEFTFDFSVDIFTFSLELVLMTIKSFDMGVTISFTSGWAFVVSATPGTEFVTRTNITIFHESLVFSVRFSTVEAWALFGDDAGFSFFIKNVSFKALTTRFAVVVKVWVDFSVDVHVVTSHLHWLFALDEFSVSGTDLAGSFTSSFSTFPSTFVAFTNVAVLSSGFTGKVFSAVPVTRTFCWSNANTIVVQNSVSNTLTTWNASFNTFEFLVLFVSEGTTRSVASFTAFLEFLTGWAIILALSFFSPVFQNDTFFGASHSVQSGGGANVVHIWFSTVVLLTLVHEWLVIDQIVTFFEFSRNEDVTQLFGDWVSGFVLNAWFQSVDGWNFVTSFSLPFLDKFNDVVFDISFWGEEVIGSITVEVTAKTSEDVFVFSGRSEMNGFSSIKDNSTTHTRDHHSLTIDSFNSKGTDVDWKRSDWFVFNVNSTTRDEFDFLFEMGKKKTSATNFSRAIVVDHSQTDRFVNGFPESVSTFTVEVVFFTIKSSDMTFLDGTNSIAFIFSTVEVTSQTDTLVTVSSKSFSGFENFITVNTWALFSGNAFTVVGISVKWTVATIDAFGLVAFGFWVEAAWSTRRSTGVVFLTGWAFNFASSISSPFDVNSMSGAFSEVSGHGVTHRSSGLIFVFSETNILFTSFKVWCWVDDIGTFGFHNVRTKHDSLS